MRPHQVIPLPSAWVDRIFEKLTLTYGRGFSGQWDGIMPIADVKADWAHELSGFSDKPECIKHALENLPPDRAPNVLQFRAMCQKSPPPAFKALPPPEIDKEKVREMIAKARAAIKKI